jgi:hypothetical protein
VHRRLLLYSHPSARLTGWCIWTAKCSLPVSGYHGDNKMGICGSVRIGGFECNGLISSVTLRRPCTTRFGYSISHDEAPRNQRFCVGKARCRNPKLAFDFVLFPDATFGWLRRRASSRQGNLKYYAAVLHTAVCGRSKQVELQLSKNQARGHVAAITASRKIVKHDFGPGSPLLRRRR